VLLPRLSKVDVHVDEAGTDDESRRNIDHGRAIHGKVAADRDDAIVVDQHVVDGVDPVGGIDHAAALK
jgi:hypothetical protein